MRALVTGANGDMGLSICNYFLENNYETIAIDKKIDRLNKNTHNIKLDLNSLTEVEKQLHVIKNPIDVLVYAAGIREIMPAVNLNLTQWTEVMNVNLTSAFLLCQQLSQIAIKNNSSLCLILISSISGLCGEPERSAYCASKHGLIGMAKSLAIELAKHNIRVNVIAPGIIETGMTLPYKENPVIMTQLKQNIPLERWGNCHHIVKTVDFIIKNDYLTGSTLVVDGGWTAGKNL